ncbi:MAG: hypothetical protein HYW26_04135 [Candidatus Aenigmarchaeota archaeon]|nr:hypothetical protein [Candidatus Aenigmarchaeota archaeon]
MKVEKFFRLKELEKIKLDRLLRLQDLKKIELYLEDFISFEQKEHRKIIFYLRIYTYLVRASENFRSGKMQYCAYNLRLARKFASDYERKEKPYAERIKRIIDTLKSSIKRTENVNVKDGEYHKLMVFFRTAQGICVLRILKG